MIVKFLYRCILFITPIAFIGIILELYLHQMGENIPAESVITIQQENKQIIYQRGVLNQQFNTYKYSGIKKLKPEILVIGSSRVMQFRSEFFYPLNNKFYNAGGIIQCGQDLEYFSEIILQENLKPKVLIVGIDPWWFKKDYIPNQTWLNKDKLKDDAYSFTSRIAALKNIFRNFENVHFNKSTNKYLGLYAKVNNEGFRYDGSLYISNKVIQSFEKKKVYVDREFPPIIERIKYLKTVRFTPSEIDTIQFNKALLALKKLSTNGIEVIIYLPPFSNECYEALNKSKELKNWWYYYKEEISSQLGKNFEILNDNFCPKEAGLTDIYCLDGFHPSEVFVGHQLRLGLKNLSNNSYLIQIDKKHLSDLLDNRHNLPICLRRDE